MDKTKVLTFSEKLLSIRKGLYLDELLNDTNWVIRLELAKIGYGLETLVSDDRWEVREEVAYQGYGLDVLVNDKNEWVCESAKRMLVIGGKEDA